MGTKEEFEKAFELMSNCTATVSCGCEVDFEIACYLRLQCKCFLAAFDKRFKDYDLSLL